MYLQNERMGKLILTSTTEVGSGAKQYALDLSLAASETERWKVLANL